MSKWAVLAGVVCAHVCVACTSPDDNTGPDATPGSGSDLRDAGSGSDAPTAPTAAQLMAKLASCDDKVGGDFARDDGAAQVISICGLSNAVFWTADLDVDCDGKSTSACNASTDPDFENQTAATDSHDNPLDAAALPYVAIPGVSTRFDYAKAGLAMGSVVAVIYQDHLAYGVIGDVGPTSIIGEASAAMATSLGIDPDPVTGGTDDAVSYIAFTGDAAVVSPIEDHDAAVSLGIARATDLISQ